MFTVFVIFLIIICALLIMIVLVQNSKGGGLASNFSGSNQFMGVRKTTDFLEKATWTLAASLLVFSLLATWALPTKSETEKARVEGQFDNSRLTQPENNVINLPEAGTGQIPGTAQPGTTAQPKEEKK